MTSANSSPPPAKVSYDAVILISFGGPESKEEVMPFLEHVVRGRRVPKERLLAVAEHYDAMGGKSPINDQNRELIRALEARFEADGPDLPVYFGNRHSKPFLEDTLRAMKEDGVTRAVGIVTSAYSSFSGCRQYQDAIAVARAEIGDGAPEVDIVRRFWNHPGFVEAMADRVREAFDALGGPCRIAFTAHSIPVSMAEDCDYELQLQEACELVGRAVGRDEWQLVYQSRSGPPEVPWLGPDILEHVDALGQIGVERLVIAPIGFVSDHMEVIWDLDREAAELCEQSGITMVRAGTAGVHPAFVEALRELVLERTGAIVEPRFVGDLGPRPMNCAPGCCPAPPPREGPPTGERAALPPE